MERVPRIELGTSYMASRRSTSELHPHHHFSLSTGASGRDRTGVSRSGNPLPFRLATDAYLL